MYIVYEEGFSMVIGILIIMFLIFAAGFIFTLPVLMLKKSTVCPVCENKLKVITQSIKCPRCKTKIFKQSNGEYRPLN